jgi:hypothetical protein
MLDRSLLAKEKVDFACNDSSVPQPLSLPQRKTMLKKDGKPSFGPVVRRCAPARPALSESKGIAGRVTGVDLITSEKLGLGQGLTIS